jgi:hypothetical protein
MITESRIPVAAGTYVGTITGKVADRPWRDQPVTVPELPTLLRMVYAAGFTAICYLSGMRPGEKRAELHLMQHSAGPRKRRFRSSAGHSPNNPATARQA